MWYLRKANDLKQKGFDAMTTVTRDPNLLSIDFGVLSARQQAGA